MGDLEDAMGEIDRARDGVDQPDVRTELDSIGASLQEMLDTEAGERTDADVAYADTDFAGAAPSADNLRQLEANLRKLAERADEGEVRDHLDAARQRIVAYRTQRESRE